MSIIRKYVNITNATIGHIDSKILFTQLKKKNRILEIGNDGLINGQTELAQSTRRTSLIIFGVCHACFINVQIVVIQNIQEYTYLYRMYLLNNINSFIGINQQLEPRKPQSLLTKLSIIIFGSQIIEVSII